MSSILTWCVTTVVIRSQVDIWNTSYCKRLTVFGVYRKNKRVVSYREFIVVVRLIRPTLTYLSKDGQTTDTKVCVALTNDKEVLYIDKITGLLQMQILLTRVRKRVMNEF